jgi:competence protein ComEC
VLSSALFSIFLGALSSLLSLHFSASLYSVGHLFYTYTGVFLIIVSVYICFGYFYLKKRAQLSALLHRKYFISYACSYFYIAYIRLKYALASTHIQRNALLFLLSFSIFFAYATYLSNQRLQYKLPAEYYNATLKIPFKITSLPTETEAYWKFKAQVFIPKNQQYKNLKIQTIYVYIYKPHNNVFEGKKNILNIAEGNDNKDIKNNNNADINLKFNPKVGDIWNIPLKYKPPYANQNPYLFDYEFNLFHQNIHAIASNNLNSISSTLKLNYIGHAGWHDNTFIEQVRQNVRAKMQPIIANLKYKGILFALSIGDQSYLSKKEWQLFNQSGIGHLISISGLHISMLAFIFASIPLVFMRLYPKILYYINKRYVCGITGLVSSGIYVLISGAEIPAQRTWLMLCIIFLFYKRLNVAASLCVAALCIMVLDPWAVGSNSFWLSFSAVALLIFMGSRLYQKNSWRNSVWYLSISSQLGISLAMIPISIAIFGQFSVVSPLANAIAIPLISYIIAPLTLLACLLCLCVSIPTTYILFILNIAHTILTWVIAWCTYAINLPLAFGYAAIPNMWVFLISILGILCLLMPYIWRWFGLIFFIPLLLHKNTMVSHPNAFYVSFLDVGQGSSILISTQNHYVLYDTAGAYEDNIVAEKVITPTLQRMGVAYLDDLIVSHADKDHSGGLTSILNLSLPIENLWVGMSFNHAVLQKSLNTSQRSMDYSEYITNNNLHNNTMHIRTCKPSSWVYDNVQFNILHPFFDHDFSDDSKSNQHSCVLKITTGAHSVLLTADLPKEQEYELVEHYADLLQSDIMLSPHHGSKTSSSPIFLNAVKPTHIVIQNGFLNHYHHPHPTIIERYRAQGNNIWRTDQLGAISLYMDTKQYKINAQKIINKRYWML